jgi:hypothetical protein
MKNTIANMKWEIHKNPNKNNAMYISQVIIDILTFHPKANLADVEQELKDCGTNIYLLALSLESFGNNMLDTFFPNDKGYKPYALWVCVNGKAEAEKKMMEHGITAIDNLVRLHSCGFLKIKS